MLHLSHPAFPTQDELFVEDRAMLRDERDANRLAVCADLCARAIDALIPVMGRLEHPRARWCPDDLVEALSEQAENIRAEQENLKGPVYLEESDYE